MADPPSTATQGFDELYRDSAGDLYAYVRTLLHDDTSAEDVTALAFERAYRRRSTFDARRGGRRAWLFGIARNAALDELRRQRRAAPLVAELADEDLTALDEQAEQSLRRAAVRVALDSLSARERELIALKFHRTCATSRPRSTRRRTASTRLAPSAVACCRRSATRRPRTGSTASAHGCVWSGAGSPRPRIEWARARGHRRRGADRPRRPGPARPAGRRDPRLRARAPRPAARERARRGLIAAAGCGRHACAIAQAVADARYVS